MNCSALLYAEKRKKLDILFKIINLDILCPTETWFSRDFEKKDVLISLSYSIQSSSDRKTAPNKGRPYSK